MSMKTAKISEEHMQRNNAKSNGAGSGGAFRTAEFLAYRADANDSRVDKGKYSKISAGRGGKS